MLPSAQDIEDYFKSAEIYVLQTVTKAVPDLPYARDALGRLWEDVARHAPASITDMANHIPGLGAFELPPPPPPPPPAPRQWLNKAGDWANEHRLMTAVLGTSVIGTGLLVGYGSLQARRYARYQRFKANGSTERRQVVVVLGGDHPLALPLILDLEKSGFIVVVSVESADHTETLEGKCTGYVRALVLDPSDPSSVPTFLRSLSSALSRRFPINVAGDPHVSSNSQPYLHSVISLLSLPTSSSGAIPPTLAPLEHVSLDSDYPHYLQATHIAPLQVIQSLLPMLRSSPARIRDKGSRSVVVCVSATDGRVGLPFGGVQAMSAVATLKAVDILRREVAVAATTEQGEIMKSIRIVTVDVGLVATGRSSQVESTNDADSIQRWTPSEQTTYGAAFLSMVEEGRQRSVVRRGVKAEVFTKKIVGVVSGYRPQTVTMLGLAAWKVQSWFRSDRVSVGAGARTYAYASNLPPFVLDALLNLPYILLSIRNALLPIQPYVRTPSPTKSPSQPTLATNRKLIEPSPEFDITSSDSEKSLEGASVPVSDVETGSEADVESNTEADSSPELDQPELEARGISSSWVDVNV